MLTRVKGITTRDRRACDDERQGNESAAGVVQGGDGQRRDVAESRVQGGRTADTSAILRGEPLANEHEGGRGKHLRYKHAYAECQLIACSGTLVARCDCSDGRACMSRESTRHGGGGRVHLRLRLPCPTGG